MAITVDGRGRSELLFEKFYKMRRIREITFRTDLRNRLAGRNKKQASMYKALSDYPLMGRFEKQPFEFLFKRSEATVRLSGKLFYRDVVENIVADDLFKTFLQHIAMFEYLILYTALRIGNY